MTTLEKENEVCAYDIWKDEQCVDYATQTEENIPNWY
jgi:hypothetical protein